MSSSNTKKKVEAWVITHKNDIEPFWQGKALVYEIYFTQTKAEEYCEKYNRKKQKIYNVFPVEIAIISKK